MMSGASPRLGIWLEQHSTVEIQLLECSCVCTIVTLCVERLAFQQCWASSMVLLVPLAQPLI